MRKHKNVTICIKTHLTKFMSYKKKLSIICTSRDDDYGDSKTDGIYDLDFEPIDNINRIKISVEKNLQNFNKYFNFDFEYIIVDWSPINKNYLYKNHNLKEIFKDDSIKSIIVSNESVLKKGLDPVGFFELYAKNVGIRNAVGENLLITNSDCYFSEELIKELNFIFEEDNTNRYFYRPFSRFDIDNEFNVINEGYSFYKTKGFFKSSDIFKIKHNLNIEMNMSENLFQIETIFNDLIGTPASGDFTLSSNYNINHLCSGYLEGNKEGVDKNTRQAGYDGQLLINLFLYGIFPRQLVNSIYTFDHNKVERNTIKNDHKVYRNSDEWGFSNFVKKELNSKVTLI